MIALAPLPPKRSFDKSKFEILSYTSEKNAYGAELAEMLGLTTATVSHHTSELHIAGLLNIEKQGNKIYYSKNQQTIDNLSSPFRFVVP